jgi:hypothetical protein
MFINQSLVAIIFKFINFFALMGIAAFVFKKYLKADMLTTIEQKKTDHENLLTQQKKLERKQHDLDTLIKQETVRCQEFKAHIDEWKKVTMLEQDKQEKEHAIFLIHSKKRHADIAIKKEEQQTQNKIIDIVVTDLKRSLVHDFKDSQKTTDYMSAIVHFMNEKTS